MPYVPIDRPRGGAIVTESTDVTVCYLRHGSRLTVTILNLATAELRDVIVGLWSRLTHDERRNQIEELTFYLEDPTQPVSIIAGTIANAPEGVTVFDVPLPPPL